jgi:hypothetical protein
LLKYGCGLNIELVFNSLWWDSTVIYIVWMPTQEVVESGTKREQMSWKKKRVKVSTVKVKISKKFCVEAEGIYGTYLNIIRDTPVKVPLHKHLTVY